MHLPYCRSDNECNALVSQEGDQCVAEFAQHILKPPLPSPQRHLRSPVAAHLKNVSGVIFVEGHVVNKRLQRIAVVRKAVAALKKCQEPVQGYFGRVTGSCKPKDIIGFKSILEGQG